MQLSQTIVVTNTDELLPLIGNIVKVTHHIKFKPVTFALKVIDVHTQDGVLTYVKRGKWLNYKRYINRYKRNKPKQLIRYKRR